MNNNLYTRSQNQVQNLFNYLIQWKNKMGNKNMQTSNCLSEYSQEHWGLMSETVDILQTTASRTRVLIFIFWLDTWVITKRQHRHSSSLSAFCCFITSFSREGKPWHLYALANTLWNKQSCEAEPGTNFISGCHLWLITGCSQWLASRSKVLGG